MIQVSRDPFAEKASEYGLVLAFPRFSESLELDFIVENPLGHHNYTSDVKEAIFAMVLGRVLDPKSKLATFDWLDEIYEPHFQTLKLQHPYRSLDFFDKHKRKIKEGSSHLYAFPSAVIHRSGPPTKIKKRVRKKVKKDNPTLMHRRESQAV